VSTDFTFESLPDDWRPETLGSLFDVQQGKALSPEARGGASRRPFLRTRNVLWGRLDLGDVDTMSFDDTEASKLTLQDLDLLVCEGGEIGRTAVWRGEVSGCLYQNHIHRLRRKTDEIDPLFVMYWLQAAFLQLGLFEGIGNRTTIPNLSSARLKSLPVPVPEIHEQGAVVFILSKLQTAVGLETARLRALRDLKAGTMARLFLLGLQNEDAVETEIGPIPRSWSVVTLGRLCSEPLGTIQTGPFGSQLHSSDYVESGVPIVNPTHIANGRIVRTLIPRVAELDATRLLRHRLQVGDILFSRRGDVGRHAYVSELEAGWLVGTGCLLVRPAPETVDPKFLSYALDHNAVQAYLKTHAAGTIMPNINTRILSSVPIPVPPPPDQAPIADTLIRLDARIEGAEHRLALLRDVYAVCLRSLTTGALRARPFGPEEAPRV
jgi:type I restriction enzyme S subunit